MLSGFGAGLGAGAVGKAHAGTSNGARAGCAPSDAPVHSAVRLVAIVA